MLFLFALVDSLNDLIETTEFFFGYSRRIESIFDCCFDLIKFFFIKLLLNEGTGEF